MTSDDEDTNKEKERAADLLKRNESMPPRSSSQNISSNGHASAPENFRTMHSDISHQGASDWQVCDWFHHQSEVGESITFPFSAEGNQSYSVDLLFNNTFKILKWYPQSFIHVREQYKGRVSIGNDSIRLNKLSLSDSGPYQVKIEYTSGSFKPPEYTYFHLQVFETVSKPNITAECLGSNVSLSCFSSQGTAVAYRWETLPPCGNDSCVHLGQAIDLQLQALSPSTTYTCTAHNPVSRATSDSVDLEMCFLVNP